MNQEFSPSFSDFQADIEGYITSVGGSSQTPDGFTIFRGYDDALRLMFRTYLDHRAYDPLIAHFRQWNWEVGDNEYLQALTDSLIQENDWHRLQTLWESVLGKRRALYNKMRRIESEQPGAIPPEQMAQQRELLIETLQRLQGIASDLGAEQDAQKYASMVERIREDREA